MEPVYIDRNFKALDLNFLDGSVGDADADLNEKGIATSGSSSPFISKLMLAHDNAGTEVGYLVDVEGWLYDAAGDDQGWKLDTTGARAEGCGWLWPLDRQAEWECLVSYYIPTLAVTDDDVDLFIAAVSPGGIKTGVMAWAHAESDLSVPIQYQARTGIDVDTGTDLSDGAANTFEDYGTIIASGNTFTLGLRCKNGAFQIYDDQSDTWNTNGFASTIGAPFAYMLVAIANDANGSTHATISIQSLAFHYLKNGI